jgi:hypothetical protein
MLSARAIALREDLTVAEKRSIMEMLGLVEPGAHEVLDDPIRGHMHPATMNKKKGGLRSINPDDLRVPSRHAAPPAGLRASREAAGDTAVGSVE